MSFVYVFHLAHAFYFFGTPLISWIFKENTDINNDSNEHGTCSNYNCKLCFNQYDLQYARDINGKAYIFQPIKYYSDDNDLFTGIGKKESDVEMYIGDYNNGLPNGVGRIYYKLTKHTYEGGFKDGKHHGHGVYKFPDGDVYAGEWQNGKTHGHSIYTLSNGKSYARVYSNGKLLSNVLLD